MTQHNRNDEQTYAEAHRYCVDHGLPVEDVPTEALEPAMTQEDRDMLIRIDTNLVHVKEDVRVLNKTMYGNGIPGVVSRLKSVEDAHKDCKERQSKPKQWPSIVAAICAVAAVIWGVYKG